MCRRFVQLCRELKLFTQAIVAIDSSKFKAVNSRDRNFTPNKVDRRQQQIEESIRRYLEALETADRMPPMTAIGVRRAKAALSSGCKPHPANAPAGSTGAGMEETKCLKPSGKACHELVAARVCRPQRE